jgi:hypothetical protein
MLWRKVITKFSDLRIYYFSGINFHELNIVRSKILPMNLSNKEQNKGSIPICKLVFDFSLGNELRTNSYCSLTSSVRKVTLDFATEQCFPFKKMYHYTNVKDTILTDSRPHMCATIILAGRNSKTRNFHRFSQCKVNTICRIFSLRT